MPFLYYLPGQTAAELNRAQLRGHPLVAGPLRDVLATDRRYQQILLHNVHARGPDGGHGVIVSVGPHPDDQPPLYDPRVQCWRPTARGGWIGCYADILSAPTAEHRTPKTLSPENLRRPHQVPGYWRTLGDEQDWLCPVLRRPFGRPGLPSRWEVDPAGDFAPQVLDEYAAAWTLAGEIWAIVAGGAPEPTKLDAFRLAVEVLEVNYRVGLDEVSLLGLVNDTNYAAILHAAVDAGQVLALLDDPEVRAVFLDDSDEPQKKSPADTAPTSAASSTSPGPAANSPITSRVPPTSSSGPAA